MKRLRLPGIVIIISGVVLSSTLMIYLFLGNQDNEKKENGVPPPPPEPYFINVTREYACEISTTSMFNVCIPLVINGYSEMDAIMNDIDIVRGDANATIVQTENGLALQVVGSGSVELRAKESCSFEIINGSANASRVPRKVTISMSSIFLQKKSGNNVTRVLLYDTTSPGFTFDQTLNPLNYSMDAPIEGESWIGLNQCNSTIGISIQLVEKIVNPRGFTETLFACRSDSLTVGWNEGFFTQRFESS